MPRRDGTIGDAKRTITRRVNNNGVAPVNENWVDMITTFLRVNGRGGVAFTRKELLTSVQGSRPSIPMLDVAQWRTIEATEGVKVGGGPLPRPLRYSFATDQEVAAENKIIEFMRSMATDPVRRNLPRDDLPGDIALKFTSTLDAEDGEGSASDLLKDANADRDGGFEYLKRLALRAVQADVKKRRKEVFRVMSVEVEDWNDVDHGEFWSLRVESFQATPRWERVSR